MTLRKLTLATVATVALVSSAFAADPTTQNSQWGVGAGFISQFGTTTPAATVTYLSNQFIANAALAYYSVSTSGDSSRHAFGTGLAFGLRNMMNNQVSLDYGINGGYSFVSNKDNDSEKNPYAIGAFVGVDYMPVQNILFTASIDPYAYEHSLDTTKTSRVFNSGSIGVSYMF